MKKCPICRSSLLFLKNDQDRINKYNVTYNIKCLCQKYSHVLQDREINNFRIEGLLIEESLYLNSYILQIKESSFYIIHKHKILLCLDGKSLEIYKDIFIKQDFNRLKKMLMLS